MQAETKEKILNKWSWMDQKGWNYKEKNRRRENLGHGQRVYMAIFWPASGFQRRTFNNSGLSTEGTFTSESAIPHCREERQRESTANEWRQKNTGSKWLKKIFKSMDREKNINIFQLCPYQHASLLWFLTRKSNAKMTHIQLQNWKKNCVSYVSYIHTSHTKHTVPDLFHVCKNHTMFKLQCTRI